MTGLGRGAILVALAVLAACGSGNPDALTNPNLEQSNTDDDTPADLNAIDTGETDSTPRSTTSAPTAAPGNLAANKVDETMNSEVDDEEPAVEIGNVTDDENETTEPPEL